MGHSAPVAVRAASETRLDCWADGPVREQADHQENLEVPWSEGWATASR